MQRVLWSVLASCALAALAVAPEQVASAPRATAADGAGFRAGSIISDALFFDGAAMGAADVQAFLTAMRPDCATGYTCLPNYSAPTQNEAAESGLCRAIVGTGAATAAQIIATVGAACGVSQKVLLVMLQKEQGLVTARTPTDSRYRIAMGFGCPDTAACDSQYYGFFNQVYRAARQFKRYAANPQSYSYRAGRTNSILWNPNGACGSASVYIENQATAGLYNYTPYQPDAAALGNMYGAGDACSSYGNRNFWRDYTDWFGSTQVGLNLVRTFADPTVYLVTYDHKFPVLDLATLDSLSSLGSVGYVDQTFLDARATGPGLGRFIRDRAGLIYLVDRGWLFQVSDCAQLGDWGASCSAFGSMVLSDAQMAGFVKAGPLSDRVVTPEGKQFVVYGGSRHEAADASSVTLAPVLPGAPIMIREAALSRLPIGTPLVRDGLLVADRATGAKYLTDAGKAYEIAAGLDQATRLAAAFPAGALDPTSIALMNRSTTVLSGVVRGPDGVLYGLGAGPLVPLSSGQLSQAAAAAVPLSASAVAALGTATAGPLFVRSVADATLYLAAGGMRRPVSSMSDARALAGSSSIAVVFLSDAILQSVPLGAPVLSPGAMVKAPDAAQLYLVDGASTLVPVSSFDISAALGVTRWTQVERSTLSAYSVATAPLAGFVGCQSLRYVGRTAVTAATVDAAGVPVTALDPATCADLSLGGKPVDAPVFVRAAGADALYLPSDGARRPIASMATVFALAHSGPVLVGLVDQSALAAMPAGVEVLRPGTLVKATTGPEVYLVDGAATRVFLPSFAVSGAFGINGFAEVPAATLAAYAPASAPLGTALSCPDGRGIASAGMLTQVPTTVFDSSGVPTSSLSAATCWVLPAASRSLTGPVLVQAVGDTTVYAMVDGVRHPVANMDRLYALNGGTVPVIALVTSAMLAAVPVGAPA